VPRASATKPSPGFAQAVAQDQFDEHERDCSPQIFYIIQKTQCVEPLNLDGHLVAQLLVQCEIFTIGATMRIYHTKNKRIRHPNFMERNAGQPSTGGLAALLLITRYFYIHKPSFVQHL
jgi:hypothetical protein